MNKKVSVIIPTYNRYDKLLNAIKSIQNQTHKNIEIIVINDNSNEKKYYSNKLDGITVINMSENTKNKFGYPCPGYVRNIGLKVATGDYIAFLDDDDYWLCDKIKTQLGKMEKYNVKMCCSDAHHYDKLYSKTHKFKKNIEFVFGKDYIKDTNYVICSTVIIHRDIVNKAGYFLHIPINGSYNGMSEDYEYWKECMKYTNCLYINSPLIYYDYDISFFKV